MAAVSSVPNVIESFFMLVLVPGLSNSIVTASEGCGVLCGLYGSPPLKAISNDLAQFVLAKMRALLRKIVCCCAIGISAENGACNGELLHSLCRVLHGLQHGVVNIRQWMLHSVHVDAKAQT